MFRLPQFTNLTDYIYIYIYMHIYIHVLALKLLSDLKERHCETWNHYTLLSCSGCDFQSKPSHAHTRPLISVVPAYTLMPIYLWNSWLDVDHGTRSRLYIYIYVYPWFESAAKSRSCRIHNIKYAIYNIQYTIYNIQHRARKMCIGIVNTRGTVSPTPNMLTTRCSRKHHC